MFSGRPSCPLISNAFVTDVQNNHTQANNAHTAMKNSSQTLHPTPVRSAIRNIRLIVPFNLTPVFSNVSLIWLASAELSRISSPIATVRVFNCDTFCDRRVVCVISFCDSSSSRTEALYWPLEFGVAGRKALPECEVVLEPLECE